MQAIETISQHPQMYCIKHNAFFLSSIFASWLCIIYVSGIVLKFIILLFLSVSATIFLANMGGKMAEQCFCNDHGTMREDMANLKGKMTIIIALVGTLIGLSCWGVLQQIQTTKELPSLISATKDGLKTEISDIKAAVEDLRAKYVGTSMTMATRVKTLEDRTEKLEGHCDDVRHKVGR